MAKRKKKLRLSKGFLKTLKWSLSPKTKRRKKKKNKWY